MGREWLIVLLRIFNTQHKCEIALRIVIHGIGILRYGNFSIFHLLFSVQWQDENRHGVILCCKVCAEHTL